MEKIEGVVDKGVYCWDCNKYYDYEDIKNGECPKEHKVGDEK